MKIEQRLEAYLRVGVPVLLWGPPGVGKTATIVSLSRKLSLPIEIIIAAIREPSDFLGYPKVDIESNVTRFTPLDWAERLAQLGYGLLFLDELSTAPPTVQAALLRVVLERRVGERQLPRGVRIIAAANPPELAAGGWELSPPLANRFAHLYWELNPTEWVNEFPSYWGEPPQIDVPEPIWARARALVAAFVRTRPELLLLIPQSEQLLSLAWPSPRTWDNASRMLAYVLEAGLLPYESLPFVADNVGDAPALEFATWVRDMDLPDPETVLADPNNAPIPNRSDQVYAVLMSVSVVATDTEPRWLAAWRYTARCAEKHGSDVAAPAARNLALARQPEWSAPESVRVFLPVLREAGLIR